MHYPLFIDFKGKKVLIVGGGKVATKRTKALLAAGADVTVLSPSFSRELEESKAKLLKGDAVEKLPKLGGFFLVVVASDSRKVNESVGEKAFREGILMNRADEHNRGDVIFPMTTQVEGHTMAYTTLGGNPRLLSKIKKLIEDEFKSN